MINPNLIALKEFLEDEIPTFTGRGYVITPGQETDIKGITDEYPFYFYIDFAGRKYLEFDFDEEIAAKGSRRITSEFKLVVASCNHTADSLLSVFAAVLSKFNGVSIVRATNDAETVVADELEEAIRCDGYNFVKIVFDYEAIFIPRENCVLLECKEKC